MLYDILGPWNITGVIQNEYAIRNVRSLNCQGAVLAHINVAFDPDGDIARLIQAAPDLLRALIDIRDSTAYDTAAKARAAIALEKVIP